LRSADEQKLLIDDTVKAYTDALHLTQNCFEGGASPKSDVAQSLTQLDAAKVQDTDVTVARAQYEDAIAVLIGKPQAQFNLPQSPQVRFQLPVIPVGIPSTLLERRMAEANDRIGIARAAYFPTLTTGATGGFEGTTVTNWLDWPSRLWAVRPELSETLFDAGRRRTTSEAAEANYDGIVAFQDVEDNLAALRILEIEAKQQQEATASAAVSLQLFTNRYIGDVDNYLQVITAQTVLLTNQRNDIDIERRRMDANARLVKAVGGGSRDEGMVLLAVRLNVFRRDLVRVMAPTNIVLEQKTVMQ
jgi:outer membrane protein TolC